MKLSTLPLPFLKKVVNYIKLISYHASGFQLMVLSILLANLTVLGNWSHDNQSYQGGFSKIKMLDANTGYAIGGEQILKTTDGGKNWKGLSVLYPRTANNEYTGLIDLSFISANVGYVVGATSTIFKTMDGGNTWLQLTVNNNKSHINCVQFITAELGYIADNSGSIFKTENGGSTWTSQSTSFTSAIKTLNFIDANTGWFAGSGGVIKKTTDGGSNWTSQSSGLSSEIISSHFISASNGWMITLSTVLKTTNGGSNWTAVNSSQNSLTQIFFTDANNGWLTSVDFNNTIKKTTDGGATWSTSYVGTNNRFFNSIYFTSANTGFAVSGNMAQVIKTNNGGVDWSIVNNPLQPYNHYAVYFLPGSADGWMVGDGGTILKSSDGGNYYSAQTSGTTQLLTGVYAVSSSVAWVSGVGGTIRKTTDGGANWSAQTSGLSTILYDIEFFDANNGLCVGESGKILRTTNGGTTWTSITSGTTNSLRSICYVSSSVIVVIGHGGTILKSTNGGTSWSTITSGTTNNLIGLHFTSSTVGYTCGVSGIILKTSDAGSSWSVQATGSGKYFTKIVFNGTNTGWAVGQDGQIYKTTNAGSNWNSTKTFTASVINAIAITNSGNLVAACQNGGIGFYTETCPPPAPVNYSFTHDMTICSGSKTTLIALGEGKMSWYTASSGGTYLGSGEFFTTPNLTKSTVYYVQDSTCSSSTSRTAITVNVISPTLTNIKPGENCGPGKITLSASNGSGIIKWYDNSAGGNLLFTGSSFTTPLISQTTTYFAEAEDGKCISPNRSAITATINDIPNVTANSTETLICAGSLIKLTGGGADSYTWNGGISNGVSFAPTTSARYFVTGTTNKNCSDTASIFITVKELPNKSVIVKGASITSGESDASYQWINCTTNEIISGETQKTFIAKTNGNYAVIVTVNGCSDTSDCISINLGSITNLSKLVQIYPNPSNGQVTINGLVDCKLSIFTETGKLISTCELNHLNNKTITLDNLSNGVYQIYGISDYQIVKQKLIIIK